MGWRLGSVAAIGVLLFTQSTASAADARPDVVQSQHDYEAALSVISSSPYFVLITVVDDTGGITRSGCVEGPNLIDAIMVEHDFKSFRDAAAFAIAAPGHTFRFRSGEALRRLGFASLKLGNAYACSIIRGGGSALRVDRTNEIRRGP